MAKKVKRKVSQVTAGGGAPAVHVYDGDAEMDTPVTAAPRTFTRKAVSTSEFNPDYGYVIRDLKRIGVLAGSFFILLIALSFIVPQLMR